MDGKIRKAEIWEDGLRTNPHKKSFEWWYFDAHFDDGSTAVITFFTKDPSHSKGPLRPQVQIVINKSNGEKITYNKFYQQSEFEASKEKCNVKMGPNSIIGDLKKYTIHIEMPEILADIEFDRIAPSYSSSSKSSKPEYFGWFCAIPYGTVKGTIKIDGKETSLKGTGYHDHNWGIINLDSVCQYWYWGRGTAGDYSMVYSVMILPKILGGKHASVFYLAKKDTILIEDSNHLDVSHIDINPPTPKQGHLPKNITFSFENSEYAIDFNLTNPQVIEALNPLAGTHSWKNKITQMFSKPYYVRYNSDLNLTIAKEGNKEEIKGKGLYEIMILH